MTYRFRQYYIPDRMMGSIKRYIENRVKPGDFLCAVICNDLKEAVARADEENMENLPAFVAYFYNEVDLNCWGSEEKFKKWLDNK